MSSKRKALKNGWQNLRWFPLTEAVERYLAGPADPFGHLVEGGRSRAGSHNQLQRAER